MVLFGILIAFGGVTITSLNGCSSAPADTQPGPGMEKTTIYGRIVDESGVPVMGASVTVGTTLASTDINGIYIVKNAEVPKGRAVVIAKKSGYFTAAYAGIPGSNGITRADLYMMGNAATATVSAINGGTANIAGGASVTFSGGSFTDASGKAYSGQVKVAARFLDPKNDRAPP